MTTNDAQVSKTENALWVCVATLSAIIVAMVGGFLAWVSGQLVPSAVLLAGGAFGGTLALMLTLITHLRRPTR